MSHDAVTSTKNSGSIAQAHQITTSTAASESRSSPKPPDGGWGWMIVFASFVINAITDGMSYSFGIFYAEFLTYFGEGKGKTAWIASLLIGVTLSSGPITGAFVNRWGCRTVTIAGGFLCAASVVGSAFAGDVLTLIFTIGVGAGFGLGLMYLPAIVIVTVWFERRRSLATGIAVCGSGVGTFLFAPITSALVSAYGWRGALIIIGALTLNCVPFGIMFRPVPERPRPPPNEPMIPKPATSPLIKSQSTKALNKPQEQNQNPTPDDNTVMLKSTDSLDRRTSKKIKYRENKCSWIPCSRKAKASLSQMLDFTLLVDPIFILFTISNFLTNIGFYVPYVYIVPMSEKLKVNNSAYLLSIIGASNVVGRIFLGYIGDKPWVNRLWAYNTCLTIAGISTAMSIICWEFWGLALYATVFGFTIGAYVGLTTVVLVDLLGLDNLTNAFGLLLLFQGISSLIGPPFAGWLYDISYSYAPGFCMAGVAIALSGLILFFVPLLQRQYNN